MIAQIWQRGRKNVYSFFIGVSMCALLYYSEESMFHIDTRRGATNERKLERGLYTAYGQL